MTISFIMTTREWLALTRSVSDFWFDSPIKDRNYVQNYKGHFPNRVRPWIKCADGFTVSIQAGDGLYCSPCVNLEDGNYDTVELGYPSMAEESILEYAENAEYPTETVYGQVPVEVVDKLIIKHGGIVNFDDVAKWLNDKNYKIRG